MDWNLIIPSFIAGILTFLAPCTLPLVPGYLAFISGVSASDFKDPTKAGKLRQKVMVNGILYIVGFSSIFILLGSLFGLGGAALIKYRIWLSRAGGLFVIFFGLFMLGVLKLPFLNFERHFERVRALKPGNPLSSLIFGATFAFGWTPCIGPVLGSVLVLASASATILQGAFLLAIFSLGLGIPFLVIAIGIGSASRYLGKLEPFLKAVSVLGGLFLIILGIMIFTNQFGSWLGFIYRIFDFINYDRLLDYL